MNAPTLERKYALAKGLGAGDWLLPGNDGKTLWRLSLEDSADGVGWCLWRWPHPIGESIGIDLEGLEDWGRWDLEAQCCHSRGEAIQEALLIEQRREQPKPPREKDPRSIGQILTDAYAKT